MKSASFTFNLFERGCLKIVVSYLDNGLVLLEIQREGLIDPSKKPALLGLKASNTYLASYLTVLFISKSITL